MSTVARGLFRRAKVDLQRQCDNHRCRFPLRTAGTSQISLDPRGKVLARCTVMSKRFVYVLKNQAIPPRYYTGLTSDVVRRQAEHNAGSCTHTANYRPWSIDVVIEFADQRRAVAFERYLKSVSGVVFAQRHLR